VIIVRGTKKLRDRVKGPNATATDASTTSLGDWFATALFWRPQVALLVNRRTLLPVFTELAPAATLLGRAPDAIEAVLRLHDVDDAFLNAERDAMQEVRIAPTDDRSVVGVMNEFAFHGEIHWNDGLRDLGELSLRLARMPLGPLRDRSGSPDSELAAVVAAGSGLAQVIPFPRVAAPGGRGEVVSSPNRSAYRLKVTLVGTQPPIWRRVLVDGASTLDHVHEVIQAAFGWWNYHLHEFRVGGIEYGVPDPDEDWGDPPQDERRARLDAVAEEGSSFRYVYDFGDRWDHTIRVEEITPAPPGVTLPSCIDGRRACPPEDCGGTGGYRELLAAIADPRNPEHDALLEWLGRPFDPEAFDPEEFAHNLCNQRLTTFDDLG
jgi:hypothetical protein